ncbi:hypothetical protein HMPREF9548_03350, partial [Escherichia coli MS 182-1]
PPKKKKKKNPRGGGGFCALDRVIEMLNLIPGFMFIYLLFIG